MNIETQMVLSASSEHKGKSKADRIGLNLRTKIRLVIHQRVGHGKKTISKFETGTLSRVKSKIIDEPR
jgi:hypothetical protein